MCRHNFNAFVLLIMVALTGGILQAQTSRIDGVVRDSKTGDPLFGANILLVGTSMGAASDMAGKYSIRNINPGTYTVRASYIGYKSQEYKVRISAGENVKHEFKLDAASVQSQDVIVTAQALGQNQAINQQLSSNQIINVVSAAKIQELPDANAAESVGRLPGVNVLRSGGEGNEVVIRGLAPKYNKITIDGVQMSSANASDRSSDLSMISSNMLEGIQVSKTVTADMDADVLGGTVNFELREAKVQQPGVPEFNLLTQSSYNSLPNAYHKYNNYKYVGSAENRFMDEKLGVFLQLDAERKNLTSNEMGAGYDHKANSLVDYITTGLSLYNISRDRRRYNAALVLDYKLPEGKIKLTNFGSTGTTDVISRAEGFDINNNGHGYSLNTSSSVLNSINNALSFEHRLSIFQVNAKLSHSYAETKSPDAWQVDFHQSSAGLESFNNQADVNPKEIPAASNNRFENTLLTAVTTSSSFTRQRAMAAALDLKTEWSLSNMISGDLKFGGKYRYSKHSYVFDQYDGAGGGLNLGGAKYVDNMITSHFGLPGNTTSIPITYFIDPNYDYGKFLDNNYKMVAPLNQGMLYEMVKLLRRNKDAIAANNISAYGHDVLQSTINNYDGSESTTGAYLMTIINVGSQLTVIPGVRYQNYHTSYSGPRGIQSVDSYLAYKHYDTTVTRDHGYWLPDVTMRYKPFSWFDVRLSYSNTLAYPDYGSIIPRIHVAPTYVSWNNTDLVPSRSTNYDAYFSFYNNEIGLFTIGAFYKQIKDLIYGNTLHVTGANAAKYFPLSLKSPDPKTVYTIYTTKNNSKKIDDYGMEIDWQTHFWYLPEVLSGLVFSVNYTHIFSEADYPYVLAKTNGRKVTYVDTSYSSRLLYQPDDIINLSLGYDYAGFSIRVSMLYQDNIFTGPNVWPQLRSSTSIYRRWDLAAKQELPWFGLQIYGNVNNVNSANDVSVIQGGGVPISEQDYGTVFEFGLRAKL